jgi:hypothetical protein
VSEAGALARFVPADCVWSEAVFIWGWVVIRTSQVAADRIAAHYGPGRSGIAAHINIAANPIALYLDREIFVNRQIALDDAKLSNACVGNVSAYEIAADREGRL